MQKFVKLGVIAGCLMLASGCTVSKQGFVSKGNKLFDTGKYEEAALNYRKAIQKDPNFGEGYYRLALVELKLNDPEEAQKALLRAVDLQPENIDAKEKLGGLMLQYYFIDQHQARYYDIVQRMSSELLSRNPNSFEGLREKGYLALTEGRAPEAIALFRRALQVNPSDGTLTTALAQNMIRNGQAQEAEKLALDFISRQKSYGSMYDLMYAFYSTTNRPADAENILRLKVSNNPKEATFALQLAAHYAKAKKQPEMKAALQHLLDDPKDFPQARLMVGDFYARQQAYADATRYYDEGARATKDNEKVDYLKRKANVLVVQGKADEASQVVKEILALRPADEEARRIEAGFLLRTGNSDQVAAAERELQDLSQQSPNDEAVWMGLARAEELKGNLDAARTRYQEAVKRQKNNWLARYALAEIGLVQKRPSDTLQQADEILKARPNDGKARLLRAQALARLGNSAIARAELTDLAKDYPKDVQPRLELGILALSEKKYREAEQIFDTLQSNGDPRAIVGKAMSYSAENRLDKAAEILNEGLKKSPDSALLINQLASIQAQAGKYDLAIAGYRRLLAVEPKSLDARLHLGDMYGFKGDLDSAIAVYREAVNLSPKDANTGLTLARALAASRRIDEARAQFQVVLHDHPDDPQAMNEMAYFVSENGGDLNEAQRLAQRALEKAPNQPGFSDTMGCVYLKKGLRDSALQIFGNLVQKYPKHPVYRYHLGMALLENGDKGRAKKELDTALASHPSRQDEARIKELLSKIG